MREKIIFILIPLMVMLITLLSTSMGERDVDPCRLFPDGTKIRNPDDCSQGITCKDFKSSSITKCSGSTPFYDKDKNACAKTVDDNSTCTISCAKSAGKFKTDPKSCYGYFYCQDEELALYGHCPETTHFNETSQACIHAHESECTMKKLDYCTIVKDGVKFNDESNCATYHVCKKGVLTTATCSKTYYKASTGECIQKSLVNCPAHPYPNNVCGTVKKPKKKQFVNDGASCRGYFFCEDVEGFPDPAPKWYQCPRNTFFNEKTQSCVHPLQVACSEDRCEGRDLTFVSASTKGCRNYLVCSNGVKSDAKDCGNKFFDEENGICTSTIIKYPSCSS